MCCCKERNAISTKGHERAGSNKNKEHGEGTTRLIYLQPVGLLQTPTPIEHADKEVACYTTKLIVFSKLLPIVFCCALNATTTCAPELGSLDAVSGQNAAQAQHSLLKMAMPLERVSVFVYRAFSFDDLSPFPDFFRNGRADTKGQTPASQEPKRLRPVQAA